MTASFHIEGIKKGEVFSAPTVKGYRGSRWIAPVILIIGTRSRGVVSFTSRPLYPGKGPRYPLYRRLVSTLWRRERYIIPVSGFERWIVQPVA